MTMPDLRYPKPYYYFNIFKTRFFKCIFIGPLFFYNTSFQWNEKKNKHFLSKAGSLTQLFSNHAFNIHFEENLYLSAMHDSKMNWLLMFKF